MDIKEFVDEGYLQELNREYLNPMGLRLDIDEGTGVASFLDFRKNEEEADIEEIDYQKVRKVRTQRRHGFNKRAKLLGYIVRPIPKEEKDQHKGFGRKVSHVLLAPNSAKTPKATKRRKVTEEKRNEKS